MQLVEASEVDKAILNRQKPLNNCFGQAFFLIPG